MKGDQYASKIANTIKGIGNVDSLTTNHLIGICCSLYELITFCGCKDEVPFLNGIQHRCKEYSNIRKPHHNSEHVPLCFCCQTRVFLYYLGRCMEKLADDDKLPEFSNAGLSHARIADRTYGHIKNGSILTFNIFRHHNAWRNPTNMEEINHSWEFDFNNLSLKEV